MATLTGAQIASTYALLLKIQTTGLDATLRTVEDGDATASALKLSTAEVEAAGNLRIGGSNNELRFYEGANYVGFEAPALAADKIWVLPDADGDANDFLQTDGSGNLSFAANLKYTQGLYTSTSWDGDAKNGADGIIDLSSVFSMPAGISAVYARLNLTDETVGVYGMLCSDSGNLTNGIIQLIQVASKQIAVCGIVPCDGNGDVYWAQSGEFDSVYLTFHGYWS